MVGRFLVTVVGAAFLVLLYFLVVIVGGISDDYFLKINRRKYGPEPMLIDYFFNGVLTLLVVGFGAYAAYGAGLLVMRFM